MKYFIDWEFHDDGTELIPISLGIVGEDASEIYIELTLTANHTARIHDDPWMMENVVPYLNKVERQYSKEEAAEKIDAFIDDTPEFWGYYADYDWVCLCQLFGGMLKLPERFPMLCMDLQQWWLMFGGTKPPDPKSEHHALADARWNLDFYKALVENLRSSLSPKGQSE